MPLSWRRALGVVPAALAAAACGGSSVPARTLTPAPPTATPTPVVTPDQQTLTITASGVGTFDLVAIPVAILHNDAAQHGAAGVVVHFATRRSGGALGELDSAAVNLAPGETLPVTADCTDACTGATDVTVTARVGSWVPHPGPSFTASGATYSCNGCGSGHAHGDVVGTLAAGSAVSSGAPVVVFAACTAADGSVVGGGSRQIVWSAGSQQVDIPVLVSRSPAACTMGASTGW